MVPLPTRVSPVGAWPDGWTVTGMVCSFPPARTITLPLPGATAVTVAWVPEPTTVTTAVFPEAQSMKCATARPDASTGVAEGVPRLPPPTRVSEAGVTEMVATVARTGGADWTVTLTVASRVPERAVIVVLPGDTPVITAVAPAAPAAAV